MLVSLTLPFDQDVLLSLEKPTLNTSYLIAAPRAALLTSSLSLVASSESDISLENGETRRFIQRLLTPSSFRASVYQTVQAISDAYSGADMAMFAMQIHLEDISCTIMDYLEEVYTNPNMEVIEAVMGFRKHSLIYAVNRCIQESTKALRGFEYAMELIIELAHVVNAKAKEKQRTMENAVTALMEFDRQKLLLRRKRSESLKDDELQRTPQRAPETSSTIDNETVSGVIIRVSAYHFVIDFTTKDNDPLQYNESARKIDSDQDHHNHHNNTATLKNDADLYNSSRPYKENDGKTDNNRQRYRQPYNTTTRKIYNSEAALRNAKVEYAFLSRESKNLNEIQEQWTVLKNIFNTILTTVLKPILKDLQKTATTSQKSNVSGNETLARKRILDVVKAAARCLSLTKTVKIYSDLSKRFVVPLMDASMVQVTQSREKSQAELNEYEKTAARVMSEVKTFMDLKISEADSKTKEQIDGYRQRIQKVSESRRS